MTGTADILDLIDSAVRDWETGPDAVRYNGPQPAEVEDFWTDMATLTAPLDTDLLERVAQHLREMQQWTCFVCGTSWYGARDHDCNPRPYDAWAEHQMRVALLKAYRVRPHEIGIRDMGCACHTAPFPAARDYRRRSKHRNWRRR